MGYKQPCNINSYVVCLTTIFGSTLNSNVFCFFLTMTLEAIVIHNIFFYYVISAQFGHHSTRQIFAIDFIFLFISTKYQATERIV